MKKKMNTNKTFFRKGSFKGKLVKDKRAVSPVIGEVLTVAVVVVLAATIAAFVFGIGVHRTSTLDLHFSGVEAHTTTPGTVSMITIGADTITVLNGGDIAQTEMKVVLERNGVNNAVTKVALDTAGDKTISAGDVVTVTGTGPFASGDDIRVVATDPGTSTLLVVITVKAL